MVTKNRADTFRMYNNYSSSIDQATFSLFAGLYVIILVAAYVAYGLTFGALYEKMGQPKWKAWVPVYSQWTFFQLAGYNGALALLAFASAIPIVGWIGTIVYAVYAAMGAYRISRAFGKEPDLAGWTVLYIFAAPVWAGILGFGKSQVVKSPLPAAGPGSYPPAPPTAF